MSTIKFAVCVAWHREQQRDLFLKEWGITTIPNWLFMEQDVNKEGCAVVKNRALQRAYDAGAKVLCVIDDDCFGAVRGLQYGDDIRPGWKRQLSLKQWALDHVAALQPQSVRMFEKVTEPQSRGTPFLDENHFVTMPVAASMGYWTNVGDYDAPSQLVHGATHPMKFSTEAVFGRYFAFSGMNCAISREWFPFFKFINVSRYDDIWLGFILQKIAYSRGYCINLNGPLVWHSRQSAVFQNLKDEALWAKENETCWRRIFEATSTDYDELRKLLPV